MPRAHTKTADKKRMPRTLQRSRTDLSHFLQRHRARLMPADVGLPSGGRRRTPGLRREEVAALAGVGITWYTWFEQGREIGVSEGFLLRLAKVLRLDDAECSHLFILAHQRPPSAEAYHWPSVSPLVQQLIDELVKRPAYVANLRWDVVAWNDAAERLFGFAGRQASDRNLLRMLFTEPSLRRRLPSWRGDAPRLLESFRRDVALVPDDPAMAALVEQLKKLSPDFRRWWSKPHEHAPARGLASVLIDERVVELRHEALIVDEHRHLRMVVYFESAAGTRRRKRLAV